VSYNASAVKIYYAKSSLVRLENTDIIFYFEKRSILLQRWRCSCKFKSFKDGLVPPHLYLKNSLYLFSDM
jgi:hypothetical protein